MTADLLNQIKRERSGRKKKRPFPYSEFHNVSCIVKRHRLSKSFLKALDKAASTPDSAGVAKTERTEAERVKALLELPLFPLLTAEEYGICRSIIDRIDCPYLLYARSPDEILLCKALYSQNPSLDTQTLANEHFETLLQREIEREPHAEPHREANDGLDAFAAPQALTSKVDKND